MADDDNAGNNDGNNDNDYDWDALANLVLSLAAAVLYRDAEDVANIADELLEEVVFGVKDDDVARSSSG